ncbi:EcsC family protein [Methylomarinum sp. Ch1-1]|uniref:EcsC family protein n=1 Tax=Methylomarinum roseum TaxID=3067653 RepID=A0AAU7NV45_9GAMM|nr:EcsC family protein [Methylomarinum sp. Ch1-1]MDP4519110.1 EcsC family protein [Methylomarinum sp. Ch1-1]
MQRADLVELAVAAQRLESTNIATRISHFMGIPIEKALAALPGHWSTVVSRITRTALEKALDGALYSLKPLPRKPANKTHKLIAGVSGAIGGSFGITALAVELPISATLMLRSIADIARSHGEDLADLDTKMACLTVFALSGGSANNQESADTSYYAVRSFLSKAIGDTTNHIAVHGFSKEGAPALVKLVNAVASRFSIPVSEKLAAQTLPAIGAVGGASVNLLFMEHYQQMAKAHFSVRRLEKRYGKDIVKDMYIRIVKENVSRQRKKWSTAELAAP